MTDRPTAAFVDFWGAYNPASDAIGQKILSGFDLADSPAAANLVVHSFFGEAHAATPRSRLSFSAEPVIPERTPAHWTIDWRHRSQLSHFRLPAWAASIMAYPELADAVQDGPPPGERRFCNFIYKNPRCDERNAFFEMLHRRRPVDALGRVFHNTDHPNLADRGFANKRSIQREYRFTIAFENSEHIGYTTEKLVDAWLADTVPIYWGNPAVGIDFAPGSFLSLYEAGSLTKLVEQVLEMEHDPDLYETYRRANPFRSGAAATELADYVSGMEQFVQQVADDVRISPTRRRRSRLQGSMARSQAALRSGKQQAKKALLRRRG